MVIPAHVRTALDWHQGTRMILMEAEEGMLLMSVDQARAVLKKQIGDRSLADELIAERHAEALADARAEGLVDTSARAAT